MDNEELIKLRRQISDTDEALLDILSKRQAMTAKVAALKIKHNKPVRDKAREKQLLAKLIEQAKDRGLGADIVTRLFHIIIENSVLQQQSLIEQDANPSALKENARLAILGEKGSYSYFAGKKYFARRSRECVEIGCKSFLDVIKKVEEKDADYGVLPFENSASGSINEVYDHLQHTQLHIVGEITETIEHNLLVCAETTIDDIQTLYAHPQVFAQCSYMLTELDNVEVKPCDNTSAAMRKVQTLQSSNVAAIGPAQGGRYYDLSPIQSNLMHQNQNHSRFIIVARDSIKVPLQIPAKTTLIMSTVQTPGALVDALLVLKNHQIALTKLESRPTPGNPWEEMFYVDMHGNITDGPMQDALAELSSMTKYLKVLGCYPIESVAPTRISVAEQ